MKNKYFFIRFFFLFALTANTLLSHAQAYEFVCKVEHERWACGLKDLIELQDGLGITFELTGRKDYLWDINWQIYDRRKTGRQFDEDADVNENSQVVVYLENGFSITFIESLSYPRDFCFTYMTAKADLLNGEEFMLNDYQRQSFVMPLLRLYNITKISFDGKTIYTPNMRSAETFDAMCKTLMAKTDELDIYGDEQIDKSSLEDIALIITGQDLSGAAAEPVASPTTTASATSKNDKPNIVTIKPKEFTLKELLAHPFGFVESTDREEILRTLKQNKWDIGEASINKVLSYEKGYSMYGIPITRFGAFFNFTPSFTYFGNEKLSSGQDEKYRRAYEQLQGELRGMGAKLTHLIKKKDYKKFKAELSDREVEVMYNSTNKVVGSSLDITVQLK